jgi:N utilization substance protein A
MSIKYGMEELKIMNMLEQFSGVTPKDFLMDEQRAIFVVPEGGMARCIGKGGIIVKKMENLLKRRVKYIEFSEQLPQFVKNVVAPLQVAEVTDEDGVVTMHAQDHQTRGLLIGRSAQNLRLSEMLVKRYFPAVKELKVADS